MRAAAALDRLLAAEREAILAGRHGDLDRFSRRKLDLVARLSAASGDGPALTQMRAALTRQDRVIAAMREGLVAAREGGRPVSELTTYGPDGAVDQIAPRGRVARRV